MSSLLRIIVIFCTTVSSIYLSAQQTYTTPWFQFDMASGWTRVNQGEQPPEFPSIYSRSYGGYQADVSIRFGGVDSSQSLASLASQKRQAFASQLSNYTVLGDRVFTTTNGYSAHEYYVEALGSRFRWFDIIVPDGSDKYQASFWGYCPPQDSSRTTDSQILQMVNSARPVIDAPQITTHPSSTSVVDGDTVVLRVDYDSDALYNNVEWYHNGIPLGINSKTLEITNFKESYAGQYWAIVSSFAGEGRSRTAILSWNPRQVAPQIVAEPRSQSVIDGSSAELNVSFTSDTGTTVRWFKDGREVSQFSLSSNTTSSAINFSNFSESDAGQYWATISNSAGNVSSAKATLTWVAQTYPPTIDKHPQSISVREGQSFQLSAYVQGSAPINYEWQLNGKAIPAANLPTLSVASADSTDAGAYRLVASNDRGIAYSNDALVTVIVNNPPNGINLTVVEGNTDLLRGSIFATLEVSDPDSNDSHSIFISGSFSNYCEVSGNSLILTQNLESLRGTIAKFQLEAVDFSGASYQYSFQVPIPAITTDNGNSGNEGNGTNNGQGSGSTTPDFGGLRAGFASVGKAGERSILGINSLGEIVAKEIETEGFIESYRYKVAADGRIEPAVDLDLVGIVLGVSENASTFYGQSAEEGENDWVFDGDSQKNVPPLLARPTTIRGISDDGKVAFGNNDRGKSFLWQIGAKTVSQLYPLRSGIFISREESANAISADGKVVVGHSEERAGVNGEGLRAVLWTSNGFSVKKLGSLGKKSSATGLSGDGSFIVGYFDSNNGREAFIWTSDTQMQSLGDLEGGENYSEASGISSDGNLVIGLATGKNGQTGFIWDESRGMRDIVDVLGKYGWRFEDGIADISANGKYLCGTALNPRGESQSWVAHDPNGLWNEKPEASMNRPVFLFDNSPISIEVFSNWDSAHVYVTPLNPKSYVLQTLNPSTLTWETIGSDANHRQTSKGYLSIYSTGSSDRDVARIFRVRE